MRRLTIVLLLLLPLHLSACALFPGAGGAATERTTVHDLLLAPGSRRYLVCGHRGDLFGSLLGGGDNTIEACERALKNGADLIEIDVHTTRDDVPVVAHDGEVHESTLGELTAAGDAPLLLSEALRWAEGRVVLVLDLKAKDLAPIVVAVTEGAAAGRVIFYAGNSREYGDVRAGGEGLYLMVRARDSKDLEWWARHPDPQIALIHGDYEWLTPELVTRVHESGRRVFANSYKTTWHQEFFGSGDSAARLFAIGIDVAQTNNPSGASRARDDALGSR